MVSVGELLEKKKPDIVKDLTKKITSEDHVKILAKLLIGKMQEPYNVHEEVNLMGFSIDDVKVSSWISDYCISVDFTLPNGKLYSTRLFPVPTNDLSKEEFDQLQKMVDTLTPTMRLNRLENENMTLKNKLESAKKEIQGLSEELEKKDQALSKLQDVVVDDLNEIKKSLMKLKETIASIMEYVDSRIDAYQEDP